MHCNGRYSRRGCDRVGIVPKQAIVQGDRLSRCNAILGHDLPQGRRQVSEGLGLWTLQGSCHNKIAPEALAGRSGADYPIRGCLKRVVPGLACHQETAKTLNFEGISLNEGQRDGVRSHPTVERSYTEFIRLITPTGAYGLTYFHLYTPGECIG